MLSSSHLTLLPTEASREQYAQNTWDWENGVGREKEALPAFPCHDTVGDASGLDAVLLRQIPEPLSLLSGTPSENTGWMGCTVLFFHE